MKSHVLGLFLGFFIVYYAATNTGNDRLAYVDLMSIIIVFGGSLSVSIMTNGLVQTLKICKLFFQVFSTDKYDNLKITRELVELSKKHHFGNLNLNQLDPQSHHPFVLDGLKLMHNKFDQEKLRTIMTNMMVQRAETYGSVVEKIEVLAKYPPAFGMMGTIIGLVAVLKEINTPDSMSKIGPAMAVALITTLYGVLLSNYVLQPIADNLHGRNQSDIKVRQLIAEGIILMSENQDPVYIREVLLSYLTPDERSKFTQIREAFPPQEELAA